MKNSLIWRLVIIVAVLAAWTWSFFPLQDRDFFATFEELAESQVAEYRQALEAAETEEERERYEQLLEDYDQVLSEARRIIEEDEEIAAPSVAFDHVARGTEHERGILLHNYVSVPTIPEADNSTVISRVRQEASGRLRLGLDLMGGTEFVVGFSPDEVPDDRSVEDVRDQIAEILRNRIDHLGVVEPEIHPTGSTSVSISMPMLSEDRKAEIRETLQQPAQLTFHLVHEDNEEMVRRYEEYRASERDSFEIDPRWEYVTMIHERPDGRVEEQGLFITRRPSRVRGEDVRRASPSVDQMGNFEVGLQFNAQGRRDFAELTSEHVNRRLAIVLDGTVYSAPAINEPITGGSASISGRFGPEEANRLASVIAAGNLPVAIQIDSEFGTDPTLGADSIRSGAIAAGIGLILVVGFMLAYYRIAGVIAVIATVADIVLVLGTLALLGATLTLPGIAGIILTIGIAVDANVLIYERIREEREHGKSLANAISAGYRRAFLTIFDANLTTFISALILIRFGTGPIRGFAVTLGIGVVCSMFTSLFMTRFMFDLLLYFGRLKKLSMAVFVRNTAIPFLKFRRIAIVASVVLVVFCLGGAMFRGSDILGIDFAGGTSMTFRIPAAQEEIMPEVGELREFMEQQGYPNVRVSYKYTGAREEPHLEVIFPEEAEGEAGVRVEELNMALQEGFSAIDFDHVQTVSVGSMVGEQFQRRGIMAAVLVAVALVIYISLRFELAYAVASVVALVHDVIIAAGVYLLFGRELSLPVLAALLAIMGYSLNDTIVLFDRIREDIGLLRGKTYGQIINISINQVLSRTIITSATTLLVALSLFLFGGGAINDFALVIVIGVLVGTYSSIFIASALVAVWHKPSTVPEDRPETANAESGKRQAQAVP